VTVATPTLAIILPTGGNGARYTEQPIMAFDTPGWFMAAAQVNPSGGSVTLRRDSSQSVSWSTGVNIQIRGVLIVNLL